MSFHCCFGLGRSSRRTWRDGEVGGCGEDDQKVQEGQEGFKPGRRGWDQSDIATRPRSWDDEGAELRQTIRQSRKAAERLLVPFAQPVPVRWGGGRPDILLPKQKSNTYRSLVNSLLELIQY